MKMNSYEALSVYYDRFTSDVDYAAWADFYEAVFKREGLQPGLVLDLACGTGSLTSELARRGYEMIGVDASPEMLMCAVNNTLDCQHRPLFLNQRMEHLDLYGTVDACLCGLDSVNYITSQEQLEQVFKRVHLFLEPGNGLFVFDVNTPEKFARIDGNCYVRESDDVFCVWQAAVEDGLCAYRFDIFSLKDGHWRREQEFHEERIYTMDNIVKLLERTGFSEIREYGGQDFSPVRGGEDRVFFTARRRD